MPSDKWTSAGGVVLDTDGPDPRVFVCKPSNNYGPWCFPKGRVDKGEDLATTALREVQEETGIPARMLPDGYLGTGIGSYSITHYYMMVRTGPLGPHDYEMEEVRSVTLEEAEELFKSEGNSRDVRILNLARAYLEKHPQQQKEGRQMNDSVKPLNELHMNLLGKIFFTTLGAWLVGKYVNTKLRGSQEQVQAVSNALLASKRFQEELRAPGASVESVMQKLNVKNMSAAEFERVLGVRWPL